MKFDYERFTCEVQDNVAHVRFKGAHVAEYNQAKYLSSEFRRMVTSYDFKLLVLDCEGLTFVTSTVLEAFLVVHLLCRKLDRIVRIVNAEPIVKEALRSMQIDRVIPVYDRLEESVKLDLAN